MNNKKIKKCCFVKVFLGAAVLWILGEVRAATSIYALLRPFMLLPIDKNNLF